MDPNATLKAIRANAAIVVEQGLSDEARELAEQIQALDEWLTSGGFVPNAWKSPKILQEN